MRFSQSPTAEGIILKRKSAGEADRILTIYTRQFGKLRVIAKGIRKIHSKRAPHLEVFRRVRFSSTKATPINYLTEVESIGDSQYSLTNLRSVTGAYYICELVDAFMPEKMENEEVYELLLRAIVALQSEKQEIVIREFPRLLLVLLGYYPKEEVPTEKVDMIIEGLIEKRLKTPKLFSQMV